MSPTKWVLGCSVFLAALGGLVLSTYVVNVALPSRAGKVRIDATATAGSDDTAHNSVIAEPRSDGSIEGAAPTSKVCVDVDGKSFGWHWPNVPFGTVTCH